jgi:small subunit ribosomal protein S17
MATAATKTAGRDIGLGVPAPARSCDDRHCPFHGHLPVRGSVIEGEVVSASMQKTVVVRRDLMHGDPKFERLLRVQRKYTVHAPPCLEIKVGDLVRIAECRPVSKTVSFVVVAVTKPATAAVPLTLPTAKPEEIPLELSARPIRAKRFRDKAEETATPRAIAKP